MAKTKTSKVKRNKSILDVDVDVDVSTKKRSKRSSSNDSIWDGDDAIPQDKRNRMDRKAAQRDPTISGYLEEVKRLNIDPDVIAEINDMFITSKDMKLKNYSYAGVTSDFSTPRKNMKKIAEAILKIQAMQDRVLRLQFQIEDSLLVLNNMRRVAVERIHENFSSILKTKGSLQMQSVYIESVIEEIIAKRDLFEMIANRIDKIVKNLSSAHFSFARVQIIGESFIRNAEGAHGLRE